MFCSNCGQRLEDGMLFCPNCGTKIQWELGDETVRESHALEEAMKEVEQEENRPEENVVAESKSEEPVSESGKLEELQKEELQKEELQKEELQKEELQKEELQKEELQKKELQKKELQKKELQKEEASESQEKENLGDESLEEVSQQEISQEQNPQDEKPQDDNPSEALPQEKMSGKKKGGVGIWTFLLCLIMFLGVLASGISGALRFTYTEEKVCSMMNRLDVTQVTIPTGIKGEELSVVDFLEKASDFNFEKTAGVKKKDLEKLLCKPYVSELATKYVAGYVNYFFTGKKPESFTRNDVVDFVREHDDDFCELMKFRFTYLDPTINQRKVYTVDIDNAFKDLGTDEITVDWIQETSGIKLSLICTLLSIPVLVGVGVLSFILFVIVILIQPKKHKGVFADGLTLFFAGLVMDVTVEVGVYLWGTQKSNIVSFALSPLFHNLLILGSTILVMGLIMILLAGKAGSKKKEKVAQAEMQEAEQRQ